MFFNNIKQAKIATTKQENKKYAELIKFKTWKKKKKKKKKKKLHGQKNKSISKI